MAKKIYEKNGSSHRRLEGKVAIITGAGTGIGEAIAHKFAKEGAAVVVNGLPGDPIDDVVARIRSHGASAVAYAGDVSEESHARACVQAAIDSFGRLDVLFSDGGEGGGGRAGAGGRRRADGQGRSGQGGPSRPAPGARGGAPRPGAYPRRAGGDAGGRTVGRQPRVAHAPTRPPPFSSRRESQN